MDFAAARRNMINSQVLPNKVTDPRVIDAMSELPREAFVPEARRAIAYADEALDLGGGRSLMEPMIIARLLQAARINAGDVVLGIGCCGGYSAAVLSRLASTVVAIESDKELAKASQAALSDQGIDTVAVIQGKMVNGYPKQAPYDVIFFDGAVPEIPAKIEKQLGEGGRLVAVQSRGDNGLGTAVLVTRHDGHLSRRDLMDVGTPTLPGFEREPAFTF